MSAPENTMEIPLVALDFMNEDHGHMIEIINNISDLLEEAQPKFTQICESLEGLLAHCQEHFAREETLMQQHDFFALGCHRREHQALLQALEDEMVVWQSQSNPDVQRLENYIQDKLMTWLANHVSTMDYVTAMFVHQRQS